MINDKGLYPDEVEINNKDIYEKTSLPLYKIYQQKLIELNSCDLVFNSTCSKNSRKIKILEKFILETSNIF